MAHPQLTDFKIKKLLIGYRYPDQVAEDVLALISNFKNLKVQDPRKFVHYNGSTEVLLCLSGTIPVTLKRNRYNIPIAIWLRKEHPYYKPIVFVTPTPEMGIAPSRFVNTNGNVFLPYLDEWKQGVSDLTTLTQILSATFGDFCPVYDKHLGKFKESSEVSSSNKASDQYRATPEFSKQQKPSSFGGNDGALQLPQALQLLQEKDRQLHGFRLQLAAATATNQQIQQQVQSLQQSKDDQLREHTLQLHTASVSNQQLIQQVQSLQSSLEDKESRLNTSSQSTCSYHSEFWEVHRDDITLNMHKILGTGAWGYVVEGQFRGQTIAVKCLHDLIRHPEVVSLIRQEISVMAQLRHPNLVLFIAAVLDEESDPLIITELLDVSLRKAYEKHLLVDMRSKGSIYRDIACALNYLHLHHHGAIIHRDVSSANVLLEGKPNKQWKAKLSDFGSAKLVADATTVGPGAMVYAAPEVREKSGVQQSPMVDVYSYGVLLCEVTVEEFPTERKYVTMVQSIKDSWPNLFHLITSCNSANPENRPTMANILTELDKLKL